MWGHHIPRLPWERKNYIHYITLQTSIYVGCFLLASAGGDTLFSKEADPSRRDNLCLHNSLSRPLGITFRWQAFKQKMACSRGYSLVPRAILVWGR